MMNYNDWGYGNQRGDGLAGFIFMSFMFLVVVMVIAIFVRHLSAHSATMHRHGETALDLLDKRYARGEIEKKEYGEKRKDLGG